MDYTYIFDVDGCLTPPRQKIVPVFAEFFQQWIQGRIVYLTSGSTFDMLLEQIDGIVNKVSGLFPCQGNQFWSRGRLIYSLKWESRYLESELDILIKESPYPHKVGFHIDVRAGMINFSTIGRNATPEQRQAYFEWDKEHRERLGIVRHIQSKFPELQVTIGGQISVDIAPIGCDKSQIRNKIRGPIVFVGDRICPEGNDWPLALAMSSHTDKVVSVTGWQQIQSKLLDVAL